MSLIEIIVLALIQGLTEFLPISSSAHLILPSQVFGWQDQGLAFDVAVHVGTLFAVVIYFRKEVAEILTAWFKSFGAQGTTDDSKLGWFILLATLPSLVIGYFAKDLVEAYSRNAWIIAGTTVGFGLLLWYADKTAKQIKTIYQINWVMALCIGLSQVVAMLLPGTSRSGITMTIGLMMGLNKQSAARFSFLMSIPVIAAAGSYLTYKLISEGDEFNIADIVTGAVLSFFAAYACIHYFLKVIEKMGMLPFVIYRLALGMFLVIYLSM